MIIEIELGILGVGASSLSMIDSMPRAMNIYSEDYIWVQGAAGASSQALKRKWRQSGKASINCLRYISEDSYYFIKSENLPPSKP